MSVHDDTGMTQNYGILARIDRLPPSRHLTGLVARIAAGGWFEFYELFMPGFISIGLVRAGIFTMSNRGLLDYHSFASFLGSFFFGMLLSTALFGFVSDRFGRRSVFIYSMVFYSIAQLFVAILTDPLMIDLARLFAGFAVGMQLVNNDSYLSELTPRSKRGRYMTGAYIFVLSAIPIVALFAAILVPLDPFGISGWRFVVAFGSVGGILVWSIQRGLKESPRWLEAHGRVAEADAIVSEIEASIETELGVKLPAPDLSIPDVAVDTGAWREMFSKFYLPRTLMLCVFQFAQPFAVFGFTAFVPVLLMKHGFTIVHSLYYSMMIVLLAPVGAGCAAHFAERIERKWQLVLMALFISISGTVFALAISVPLVVFSGACIALGNSWLTATFHPYAAEIFPTRIRARAVGFTFSWSRIGSIFVGFWVSDLLAVYGPGGVFTMIGIAMLAIMISIGVFGPKTNGSSLEVLSP
ncbi:MAG: MFS transporter [Acidocella sp.]|nr:MFS transporter [Acidocella sp.]